MSYNPHLKTHHQSLCFHLGTRQIICLFWNDIHLLPSMIDSLLTTFLGNLDLVIDVITVEY